MLGEQHDKTNQVKQHVDLKAPMLATVTEDAADAELEALQHRAKQKVCRSALFQHLSQDPEHACNQHPFKLSHA